MAQRRIVFTHTAAKQRRAILEYWTKRNGSPSYAKRLIRISNAHLSIIAKNPETFKKSPVSGIYVSAMGHFSLFYQFSDDEIIVMAFWDNRQDPEKLLQIIQ